MTHDPLCPTQTMCKCKDQECWDCRDVILCQCELIATVRADERQRKGNITDIPGHESGCIWEVKRTCICDILWDTRREAFNEGWNDGFDEGSMWIGVDVNGSNS